MTASITNVTCHTNSQAWGRRGFVSLRYTKFQKLYPNTVFKKTDEIFLNLDCQSKRLLLWQSAKGREHSFGNRDAASQCNDANVYQFATAFLHIPVVVLGRWHNILSIHNANGEENGGVLSSGKCCHTAQTRKKNLLFDCWIVRLLQVSVKSPFSLNTPEIRLFRSSCSCSECLFLSIDSCTLPIRACKALHDRTYQLQLSFWALELDWALRQLVIPTLRLRNFPFLATRRRDKNVYRVPGLDVNYGTRRSVDHFSSTLVLLRFLKFESGLVQSADVVFGRLIAESCWDFIKCFIDRLMMSRDTFIFPS